jgi:hypothetical protein
VILKVSKGAEEWEEFAGASELLDAANRSWPPAEFLRREGNAFVNDGCNAPLPPGDVDAGVEAMERLVPVQKRGARRTLPAFVLRHRRCDDLPKLSCGTLQFSMLREAEAKLERYYSSQYWKYDSQRDREPRAEPGTRAGSRAGCAVSGESHGPWWMGFMTLLMVAWRRFARVST